MDQLPVRNRDRRDLVDERTGPRCGIGQLVGAQRVTVDAFAAQPPFRRDRFGSQSLVGEVLAANGCEKVVTFDKAAARLPGFDLLK